jgi:hypothetical protein
MILSNYQLVFVRYLVVIVGQKKFVSAARTACLYVLGSRDMMEATGGGGLKPPYRRDLH